MTTTLNPTTTETQVVHGVLHVLHITDGTYEIYRRHTGDDELVGTYDSAAVAMNVLDMLEA